MTLTFEKSDVWSANILHIDSIGLGKSLIQIENSRGLNTKPCGASASACFHDEVSAFKTTLCWRPVK